MPRPRSVTDEQILEGALKAIGKHGPARLTLAHVASEVGLSPATLLQRFGSKAALLAAVAGGSTAYAEEAFDEAAARTESPLEALMDALAGFARAITTREELANHLAMLQLDVADPKLRGQAADQAAAVRRRIAGLLAQATRQGELAGDTNAGGLAETVYTAYNGALITWALYGQGELQRWLRKRIQAVLEPHRR
ncbi:MAG TPA: TetR/AcrR family transcriptional regulator [Actinomycetota bacterium]|nr:TetR/AcrR family transcriptional regulator [Actinomycetota bacterium]